MDVAVVGVGLVVGLLYGLFGAGGSAFATPALALLGVPPIAAVASPLPATLPGALAGAVAYVHRRDVDVPTLRRAVTTGVPATIVGALCAPRLGGLVLLVLSGVVLTGIGLRMALASATSSPPRVTSPVAAWVALTAIGFTTGLLANSGGFLLVPAFVLLLGLDMRRAAGTSLLAAAALSLPTIATHALMGAIHWPVAVTFGVGLLPGVTMGSRLAGRARTGVTQRAFGVALATASVLFLVRLAA